MTIQKRSNCRLLGLGLVVPVNRPGILLFHWLPSTSWGGSGVLAFTRFNLSPFQPLNGFYD